MKWFKRNHDMNMTFAFFALVGCGDLPTGSPADSVPVGDKEEYRQGKADWPVDYCAQFGWYADEVCDSFCPKPDPDCAAHIDESQLPELLAELRCEASAFCNLRVADSPDASWQTALHECEKIMVDRYAYDQSLIRRSVMAGRVQFDPAAAHQWLTRTRDRFGTTECVEIHEEIERLIFNLMGSGQVRAHSIQ